MRYAVTMQLYLARFLTARRISKWEQGDVLQMPSTVCLHCFHAPTIGLFLISTAIQYNEGCIRTLNFLLRVNQNKQTIISAVLLDPLVK